MTANDTHFNIIPTDLEQSLTQTEEFDLLSESDCFPNDDCCINVGGTLFSVSATILQQMHINVNQLIKHDNTPFLDKDPTHFTKVVKCLKKYGYFLTDKLGSFSKGLINELYLYNIIESKLAPRQKLKLVKTVNFSVDNRVINVAIGDYLFQTFSQTLAKSAVLNAALKERSYLDLNTSGVDAKTVRCFLNILRNGYAYVYNQAVLQMLHTYQLAYSQLNDTKATQKIVHPWLTNTSNAYSPLNNDYCECVRTLVPTSNPLWGTEIIFDLAASCLPLITDLWICIDIPTLNPTKSYEYVSMIEYKLFPQITLQMVTLAGERKCVTTNPYLMYLYPLIYQVYANYHSLASLNENKYNGHSKSPIHQIILPLFLLVDYLPMQRITKAELKIQLAAVEQLFVKDSCLLADPKVHLLVSGISTIIQNNPPRFLQTHHFLDYPIENSCYSTYDQVVIPLNTFHFIRSFFFVIVEQSNVLTHQIDQFSDQLIDVIIYQQNKLHSQYNAILLNHYIPLKKLRYSLPKGVYYCCFSNHLGTHQKSSGLKGSDSIIVIRMKKMAGTVRCFFNECVGLI